MNQHKFLQTYNESRNGTDCFYFHSLCPSFHYSDGMQELASTGCYWLLDFFATEFSAEDFLKHESTMLIVNMTINKDHQLTVVGNYHDTEDPHYSKEIPYTDLPEGVFNFYLNLEEVEGKTVIRCILPSEY